MACAPGQASLMANEQEVEMKQSGHINSAATQRGIKNGYKMARKQKGYTIRGRVKMNFHNLFHISILQNILSILSIHMINCLQCKQFVAVRCIKLPLHAGSKWRCNSTAPWVAFFLCEVKKIFTPLLRCKPLMYCGWKAFVLL